VTPPTIAVVIPTIGRELLAGTIRSIVEQYLVVGDQVFVVSDGPPTCPGSECLAAALVATAASRTLGVEWIHLHHEDHDWGNPQRNFVLASGRITADLVSWNDDDDEYTPGAFTAIRTHASCAPDSVLLFRYTGRDGRTYWLRRGLIARGTIDTHCIVTPRQLCGARWPRGYAADSAFIAETLVRAGGVAVWCDEVIAVAKRGL
jgi:hypothetical protein